MRDLDNPDTYRELDPTGMRARLATFAEQCESAWKLVSGLHLPHEYSHADKVVLLGMGGSAIGGDLLAGLASYEEAVPILVSRDYNIPSYVDDHTLVIACSYSGNTAETLSGFRQAVDLGANVVAVTSGGRLAAEARERGVPAFIFSYQGEPRCALGYTFLSAVGILQGVGLLQDKSADVSQTVERLRELAGEWGHAVPSGENPAKELAQDLVGKAVVVYGSGAFGAVARRWKTQLNENAKTWAFWDVLPEAHHNSVVGYGLPQEMARIAAAVLIYPQGMHPQLERRYDLTCRLLDEQGIPSYVVDVQGPSPLCQMLTGTYFGDWVSYYLAMAQGIDPSPIPPIDFIKSQLG